MIPVMLVAVLISLAFLRISELHPNAREETFCRIRSVSSRSGSANFLPDPERFF